MAEPVIVIGVGAEGLEGLSAEAHKHLNAAGQIWASERLLAMLPPGPAIRIRLDRRIRAAVLELARRSPEERVVLLASGDPGFFGLGATVLDCLPADQVIVIPAASSLQTAFARARLPWSDAHFTSAHGRSLAEAIGYARRFRQLGILTDPTNTPARIASALLAAQVPDGRAVVFENLGEPWERMVDARLSEIAALTFGDLNVMLVVQDAAWRPPALGVPRPDEAYAHRRGLITKADVRALCLSRLAIGEMDVVWDIGAGSGAVSIEMAERAWRGKVYAVEQETECLRYVRENLERYGCVNVEPVAGAAPEALAGLPAPDAVFIGGTGGHLDAILAHVAAVARPGCRVVANFALIENATAAHRWMQIHGWHPELVYLQFAYGAEIGAGTRLSPANPVWMLAGVAGASVESE